jgi:hypothetical protein
MMLHFPTVGVSLTPGLRGLGRTFGLGDGSDPCVNSDGTIDNACVQQQSLNEGTNLINYQDTIDSQEYANCESNLALNNAQRVGNGQPLLPDTCAQQFPANANETVYTGYGNVTSGSGSPSGGTYYGQATAPVISYNPAPAYNVPAVQPTLVTNPPLAGSLPVTASPVVSNPLLGTTNVPTPAATGTGADIMLGSFDLTQNWMWVAGGAAVLLLVMSMGGRR